MASTEQSRRDDLESLGYILVYFLKGELPWQGLPGMTSKEDKYQAICDKKLETTVDELCQDIPEEFATFINYAKSLRFTEVPDYCYLRKLLRDLFFSEGFEFDCIYDWTEEDEDSEEDIEVKNPALRNLDGRATTTNRTQPTLATAESGGNAPAVADES